MEMGKLPARMLLLLLVGHCGATLAPPDRPYNILMLLPVSSKSHRHVFMPLATALTQRGHKVTMLSNYPPADNNPNITYIEHGLPYFKEDHLDFFDVRDNVLTLMKLLSSALPKIAKDIYQLPAVEKLYQQRRAFDLIVIDQGLNELVYPFVRNQTFITISSPGLEHYASAVFGNLLNPAYVHTLANFFPHPMTFTQRFVNVGLSILLPWLWKHQLIVPKVQTEVSKHFPDLPPLLEIERNQSLVLLNSHFSLSTPLPLVPGQIEVGCMHCRPGKPLPQALGDFVRHQHPAVYFSLGTFARGTTMPLRFQRILLSVFAKLPYRVVWKFEGSKEHLPENIMMKKWLPQQDILAHPNVKLFISHCGLLSTQEAMFHGTPVLALPVFGDQPRNAAQLQDKGMAKMLVWEELTEDLLTETIKELINSSKYRQRVAAASRVIRDQLQSPVERAVYWTEYTIRRAGAVHLRSPEIALSWIQLLHLDIILVAYILLFTIFFTSKKLFALVLRKCVTKRR